MAPWLPSPTPHGWILSPSWSPHHPYCIMLESDYKLDPIMHRTEIYMQSESPAITWHCDLLLRSGGLLSSLASHPWGELLKTYILYVSRTLRSCQCHDLLIWSNKAWQALYSYEHHSLQAIRLYSYTPSQHITVLPLRWAIGPPLTRPCFICTAD